MKLLECKHNPGIVIVANSVDTIQSQKYYITFGVNGKLVEWTYKDIADKEYAMQNVIEILRKANNV